MRSIGLILLFCFSSLSFAAKVCEQQHCVAIIDAGSSGSRLHIYSYDIEENTPGNITELYSKKIRPGITLIDNNPNTINKYLDELFTNAPEHTKIPVYFYATAGMRLLSQSQQETEYSSIRKWFNQQSQWELKDARTITGTEEGVLGWLSLNYQLKKFSKNELPVAAMDMGGASVQVVFPLNTEEEGEDIVPIRIYGHDYKIFVHSFLGLGQNEVTHQFLDEKACFATGYQLPSGNSGQGDINQCETKVVALMNGVHQVSNYIQPMLSKNAAHDWYVMGGLVDIVHSKPFEYPDGFTLENLLNQANEHICQQTWNNLKTNYPANDYLYGYCLFPAYYYALIVDGYGINPQQPLHYLDSNMVGDWTTGAVIYQHVH